MHVKINKACEHRININKLSSVTCGSSSYLASPSDWLDCFHFVYRQSWSDVSDSNAMDKFLNILLLDPIQPNPTQSNTWMDSTHHTSVTCRKIKGVHELPERIVDEWDKQDQRFILHRQSRWRVAKGFEFV